jgi:TetR/AcrR family transcriptional regulator, regulator of cefoperazone and chloramphenicol sensitivity
MLKNLVENLCRTDQREQRGAATRLRLIDAAIRLFSEKGFKAVSVRELADQAKSNVAAISYHFGDKSGLYREAFSVPVKELLAAAEGMNKPSGMLATFIQEVALPIHLVVLGRIHLEIDAQSHERGERADPAIQRIAFMMFGLAMDFYVQSDFVEAFAPELIQGPGAIDDLIDSLVRAACGIVLSEKTRRDIHKLAKR